MKNYPSIVPDTEKDIKELLRYVVKERTNDVNDFNNLKNVFMSGRKTGKIPVGSSDVTNADRVGDFSFDVSYFYILVDNAGTAEWRRIALASW